MRLSNPTATAALTLISSASARIYAISAPSTIAPGVPFTISVLVQNYIQSVADISIAFGIAAGKGHPGSLGDLITSEYLGPDKSNTIEPLNYTISVPTSTAKGQATINSVLTSLYGVSHGPVVQEFNVTVTVGDATSAEIVRSNGYFQLNTAEWVEQGSP